jgi:hypothetical protein
VEQRPGALGVPLALPAVAVVGTPGDVPEPIGRPTVASEVEGADVREDDEV